MTPEQLKIYFETSPAIRLLQAKNAPYIVSFLHKRFKQAHVIDIPHSELLVALTGYQEQLEEEECDVLRDKPDEYLRDWSSSEKRWLHRFLEAGRNEPIYQLTRHAEDVIEFLQHALQHDLTFVGTESRLRLVIQALEELLVGASDDPAVRLAHLQQEQARISRAIEEINSGAQITPFAPTRIREQFSLAVRMLRQLQGDFRAVEDEFKEITRQIQHRQAKGLDSRGGILGEALNAEDELKRQDQGVTFFEFLKFIQSPQQQDRLQAIIQQLLQLRPLADQSEGLDTIRHMVRGLLDEAGKVLQTTRRLSASLKRLLDSRAHNERRRVTEVLRQLRILAASMNENPPFDICIEVEDAIEISSPFSRTNWAAPRRFEQLEVLEHVTDEKLRLEVFRSFSKLRPIDWSRMRERIGSAVQRHGSCTLLEVLKNEPLAGVVDVLGYLQIACDDGHLIENELIDEIAILTNDEGFPTRLLRVPRVIYLAGRL